MPPRAEQKTILITGPPGVGKTTLMVKLEKYLRERGVRTGGIITQEVRVNNERLGFKLRDISSGKEGCLARKNGEDGPRIGRYRVITDDLEKIGVEALEAASGGSDVVMVDEVGPMEMTSVNFRQAISTLLASGRVLVVTVKLGLHYKELETVEAQGGTMKVMLSAANRETALEQVTSKIMNWLKS